VDGCEWKNPIYTATDSLNPCQDVVYASAFSGTVLRIACRFNIWANVWRFNKFSFNVQECAQNFEKLLLASSRLSVHMEQLGSHLTDFYEIWYLCIFRKSREISRFLKIWQ
jgi:hypothetical protein